MAGKKRLCRQCKSELGVDDDVCERCGARNPVTLPWWGTLIGVAMLALIAVLFVDFRPIVTLVEGLLD